MISLKGERQLAVLIENLGHSPQGVLRLNGRELLFGEADRGNVNTNKRNLLRKIVKALCEGIAKGGSQPPAVVVETYPITLKIPRFGYQSVSDTWSLASPVRKVEFKLIQVKEWGAISVRTEPPGYGAPRCGQCAGGGRWPIC